MPCAFPRVIDRCRYRARCRHLSCGRSIRLDRPHRQPLLENRTLGKCTRPIWPRQPDNGYVMGSIPSREQQSTGLSNTRMAGVLQACLREHLGRILIQIRRALIRWSLPTHCLRFGGRKSVTTSGKIRNLSKKLAKRRPGRKARLLCHLSELLLLLLQVHTTRIRSLAYALARECVRVHTHTQAGSPIVPRDLRGPRDSQWTKGPTFQVFIQWKGGGELCMHECERICVPCMDSPCQQGHTRVASRWRSVACRMHLVRVVGLVTL